MRRVTRFLCVAALSFAMAPLTAEAASRNQPGVQGRGWSTADSACFAAYWAADQNICSSTANYELGIVSDTTGTKTFVVSVYAPSASSNIGCQAVGMDSGITTFWTSGTLYPSQFGSSQNLTLTTYAPGGGSSSGSYAIQCSPVGPGARINDVNFVP